jgi:ribosomal protein S18 acetylase RimI-like enzyme
LVDNPSANHDADFEIQAAGPADYPQIAALIVAHSLRPERRCIHSDPRSGVDEAVAELEHLHAIGELAFVAGFHQGRLAGCAGAEYDLGLRRAWLRGPFVDVEDEQAWGSLAGRLLQALEERLPAEIAILDSFLDLANEWGQRLSQASGYRRVRLVHVYQAEAGKSLSAAQAGRGATGSCAEMRAEHAARVAELHQQLFPNTYLTAETILAAVEDRSSEAARKVYVYEQDGRVLGYVYGSENLGEGVVDFLGVDVEARRRGIGRALLSAILNWIFVERGLEKASLTVHDELVNAQALYEQAGFRLLYTGVHQRKER